MPFAHKPNSRETSRQLFDTTQRVRVREGPDGKKTYPAVMFEEDPNFPQSRRRNSEARSGLGLTGNESKTLAQYVEVLFS